MQQAARVSDYTALMYLGEVVEFDQTSLIFTRPVEEADGRVRHRPVRVREGLIREGREGSRR